MFRIIRVEWLKVKTYRTFWALVLLVAVLIPAGNYLMARAAAAVKTQSQGFLDLSAYDYPNVWQTTAFISRFMSLALGFLLVILVTNEYTFRTNRQNVIDGWERKQFLWAKLFWVLAFSLLATLVTTITALVFGEIYGARYFSLEGSHYIFYFLLYTLLSLCLALLVSVLLKRSGLAIVVYLAYTMVLEKLIVLLLNRAFGEVGRLMPLEAGHQLIRLPVIGKFFPDTGRYDDTVYIAMLVLYIAVILLVVFRRLLKTDL